MKVKEIRLPDGRVDWEVLERYVKNPPKNRGKEVI